MSNAPDPSSPTSSGESSLGRSGVVFLFGIALYALGFVLLGKEMSNSAPFVIIAGILLMLQAFMM